MNCPICMADGLLEFIQFDKWTVKKCPQCGHGITHPFPSQNELDKLYNEKYFKQHYQEINPNQKAFSKKIKHESSRVKFLMTSKQKGSLLDVGCGKGYFLYACKNNFNCTGFDISGVNENFIRNRLKLNLEISSWNEAPFEDRSFDAITMWHSLEHLADPFYALQRCIGWLKQDGIIIIEVPNHSGTDAKILYNKWPDWDIPFHLHHFTQKSLFLTVEKLGLEVFKKNSYHSEFIKKDLSKNLFIKPFARMISKRYDGTGIVIHCRNKQV